MRKELVPKMMAYLCDRDDIWNSIDRKLQTRHIERFIPHWYKSYLFNLFQSIPSDLYIIFSFRKYQENKILPHQVYILFLLTTNHFLSSDYYWIFPFFYRNISFSPVYIRWLVVHDINFCDCSFYLVLFN